MDAMEKTNLVIAKILQLAMDHGVSHWSLTFEDLELSEDFRTFFFPCVEWLEAEGLIRVGSYQRTLGGLANGSIENIILTSRGMAVLGSQIEIAGTVQPLSNAVDEVSRGKVDYHRIGDAIGGLLGGLTKSLGA